MSEIDKEAAQRGISTILGAVGVKGLSAGEIELIAEAVVGLVKVLGKSALSRAEQAGINKAAAITNEDEAEEAARNRK